MLNLYAAWAGILGACLAGAVTGMFFHQENWLGGYSSWERRMVRLGHISFFGLGMVNFLYDYTVLQFNLSLSSPYSSWLLVIGLITMPLVCYLSAFKKFFRHLFFIPVLSVLSGIILFLKEVLMK
jgi:hypothetical protein